MMQEAKSFPLSFFFFYVILYHVRVDLFLKTSRLIKRRTVAHELCDAGRVLVNGKQSKPSKELKQGDFVTLQFTLKSIELEILAFPDRKTNLQSDISNYYRIIREI
jgi:ribosomal 50S subunit-recycling heat shock protein